MVLFSKIKRISKRKFCPICKHKLSSKSEGKLICYNCETEWIFNPQTGVIKYAFFFGNRRIKTQE